MDLITYAACRRLINNSATGISNIQVVEGDLIFTMADGSTINVDMPIKMDCLDIEFVSDLPLSDIESNKIYAIKTALKDEEGNSIYRQYLWISNEWRFIGVSGEPIATKEHVGLVKPDGESIMVDSSGSISVSENFIYNKINQKIAEDTDIDKFFPTI